MVSLFFVSLFSVNLAMNMNNLVDTLSGFPSLVTALVVGATSAKAFDYYWKVYKSRSTRDLGAIEAKSETITLLQDRLENLDARIEDLIEELVSLKIENATLRAELERAKEKNDDLRESYLKEKYKNQNKS